MKITKGNFNGGALYTLTNSTGMTVELTDLGAGLKSIKVPDCKGVSREMLRMPDKGYGNDYHGLVIGRTSGRIQNATFTIDGKTAKLQKNNFGVDNLHGGETGLFSKLFSSKTVEGADKTDVVFTYRSPDGEGGYFGNIDFTITYSIAENCNSVKINFFAMPDCKTLCNLTNHAYFNVSGDLREPVTEQVMYLNASKVGVLDERLILRDIAPVTKEFDFRTPHKVKDYVHTDVVQKYTKGYDHPFFLDNDGSGKLMCSLYSELSKIKMEVRTSYPVVVIFGDNFGGFNSTCFECQFNPDGINSSPENCGVCTPQKPYNEYTEYTFTVEL